MWTCNGNKYFSHSTHRLEVLVQQVNKFVQSKLLLFCPRRLDILFQAAQNVLIKSWTCTHYSIDCFRCYCYKWNSKKWYYHNTKPYEAMTYCCAEFEWYFTDSITDRTLNLRHPRETTEEEWHLHKAEWRPEGSKNRHCNKRARFAKTGNVAVVCQYHLWAQQGLCRVYKWKGRKGTRRDWLT